MEKKETKWKYNIGDRIIRRNELEEIISDITITGREARNKREKKKNGVVWNHSRQFYEYHCNICGAEHLWKKSIDVEKLGCPCCSGQIRIKGINTIGDLYPQIIKYFINENDAFDTKYSPKSYCNVKCPICGYQKNMRLDGLIGGHFICEHCNSVAVKRPDLVQYFVNEKDAENITYGSNQMVLLKCPDCGTERYMPMNQLNYYGFSCNVCSDGISFPEKFMMEFLTQLGVSFVHQLTYKHFKWCGRVRYDFYIDDEIIIETHGMQHYTEDSSFNNKITFKEIQEQDEYKKKIAKENNIKGYIVIDCRWSDINWIKNSILNSRLAELYDLSNINWDKCAEFASKNTLKEVCEYWRKHNECLTTGDLVKIFHLSYCTIQRYLKLGTRFGWCDYNPLKEKEKARQKSAKTTALPVIIFKDDKCLGFFKSIKELVRQSEKKFGVQFERTGIDRVCKGKRKQYKGYTFKYANE